MGGGGGGGGLGGLKPPQIFSNHEVIYVASNIIFMKPPQIFFAS